MAHELVLVAEARNDTDERSNHLGISSSEVSSLFHRKIDFHPARKPFSGFSNGRGDFQLETLNPSCSDPRPSGPNPGQFSVNGKKADELEFLEHGLDPDLSFEIAFRRIGAGLENLGNTCFLNSVVQCLTYTEPLVAYLQSGKHQSSCFYGLLVNLENSAEAVIKMYSKVNLYHSNFKSYLLEFAGHIAGFCALCAIQKHVSRALQSSGRILAPKDLVSNLRCISRNFRNARQEDAHEYMVNLLESMHKCCLPSGVPSESPIAFEKSLVHKIFGGRLRSQVKCMQCSSCSNKFDPFLDLSLDIVKTDSVMKALKNFTAAELLDGGEKQYQCQRCKQKVRALKQLTVYKAPYVLTIHLKRFHSHNPDAKIHKKIHFESSLDLKNYVSGSYDGDLKYTLYGVLVHRGGSTHSGHYYCYVRTSSGMWYGLDDNRVFHVKESVVLEQQAYMLFYVRDRKNVVLRKPASVDMKENMQANTNQKPDSKISPLKNPPQNALTENKLNGPGSSINISGKENSSYALPKTIISKDVPDQPKNVIVSQERKIPKPDSILVHSSVPLLKKVPSDNISAPRKNHGEHLARSAEWEPKNNVVTPYTENVTTGAAHVEINVCRNIDSNADCLALTATPSASNFKSSLVEHVIDEKSGKEVNHPSSQPLFHRTSDNMDLHNVPKEGKSTVSKNDTNNGSEKLVLAQPIKLSISSAATIGSVRSKVLDKPFRKLKKKLLKYQISSMRLRSNILLWGSLSVQKRKKHRRSKCRVRKCSKGDLISAECLSDLGPSTSDKSESVFNNPSLSKKMKTKRPLERANDAVVENITSDLIFEEFKNKIDREKIILTGDQCQKGRSCGSKSNPGGSRSARESKRDILNDDLTSVLSRGLQETVVAGWDGMDLPQSQILRTNGESVSIGYIGDEWDEEYDRGKRKKVRNSDEQWFTGLNPFQEIADQKSQLKKANMVQSSSGNHPFRK